MKKVDWSDESLIRNACRGSKSNAEILRKLGLSTAGGSFNTLKRWAEKYGIQLPDGRLVSKSSGPKPTKLSDILVEGSGYNGNRLRKRLISEGLLDNRCYGIGCPVTGYDWLDKPITLHLEHINGNHRDNRIHNLTILCPNCHSQTATWGFKSRI